MLEREPIYFLSICHLKLIPVNLEPFFTQSLNNLRENTNSEMAKCNIPNYLIRKCLLNAWLQKRRSVEDSIDKKNLLFDFFGTLALFDWRRPKKQTARLLLFVTT